MTGKEAVRLAAGLTLFFAGWGLAAEEGGGGLDHTGFRECAECHAVQDAAWRASAHNPATGCLRCHDPASKSPGRLAAELEALCSSCHSQRAVLRGTGAEGIEETRSFHSGVACISCHMTGGGHSMKLLRPDDPALPEDRTDSCTACHRDNNRATRAHQLRDWHSWYREALEPLEADLGGIETRLKERPALFSDEMRAQLEGIRRNLDILRRDGSEGAHNLDYALEIMALASRRLKEIGVATDPAGLEGR
jgi:predicted CXXCH cytochrome family protein